MSELRYKKRRPRESDRREQKPCVLSLKLIYISLCSSAILCPLSLRLPATRVILERKMPPTPDIEGASQKEPTLSLQEIINIKLIESGEKEKLKELLRERLIECGWKDEMKAECRAFTRKRGRNNVTVDELVHAITPKGRSSVPDSVKAELLQRIQMFLMSAAF
eukprot:TRINITY_DN4999_c0_g1_i1.p1 TRINITY_DN4999_c0_g1~~TRINITY_DN4999_c0_g1_i1.p1  ORF type:complete len:164 (+),score=21.32 TRINITY_DN4999_c0_g1_i1:38-529(+)